MAAPCSDPLDSENFQALGSEIERTVRWISLRMPENPRLIRLTPLWKFSGVSYGYNRDLKVVLLGETNVGKTTLVYRYIDGVFQETISTIGASFSLKQWGPYNVAIWDTAGEERFSGLSSFYCRGAAAAIMAFDLSSRSSFVSLRNRFMPLIEGIEETSLKVVVGTKLDLIVTPDIREVSYEEGKQFARTINKLSPLAKNVPYFETSSKMGDNVTDLFEFMFKELLPLDKVRPITTRKSLNLEKTKKEKEDKCCVIS